MALAMRRRRKLVSAAWPFRPARAAVLLLACGVSLLFASTASAFQLGTRWSSTAAGSTGSMGSPVKLTWSFAPNGTSIPQPYSGTSSLITFLDAQFGAGVGGTDLTKRPWYASFSQSFDRWSQLSGATFTYEPHDNGAQFQNSAGSTGTRGDIRIAGENIDGAGTKLAVTTPPDFGDILIDTSDGSYFSAGAPSHLGFRNTIMHEAGHSLGLLHVLSSTNDFLMDPNISLGFDGPQIDDILGVQSLYGDVYEKSNSGLGNDSATHATALGAIAIGGTKSIGTSPAAVAGRTPPLVQPTDTDFISIDNSTDTDFYSFTTSGAARLSVALTPQGGSYMQGPETGSQSVFNASAQSDLTLAIYSTDGTTHLALSNSAPAGQPEIRSNLALPAAGQYYVRVTGGASTAQLYDLQLSIAAAFLTGDYNHNGKVDAADYLIWRNTVGKTGLALAADGNGNGTVDSADYGLWKANFGASAGSGAGGSPVADSTVPEPAAALLAAIGGTLAILARYLRRSLARAKLAAATQRQFLDDMHHPLFRDKYPPDVLAQACRVAENKLRLSELEEQFVQATWIRRRGIVAKATKTGMPPAKTLKWLARSVLPDSAYYSYLANKKKAAVRCRKRSRRNRSPAVGVAIRPQFFPGRHGIIF
jgi:serralysin